MPTRGGGKVGENLIDSYFSTRNFGCTIALILSGSNMLCNISIAINTQTDKHCTIPGIRSTRNERVPAEYVLTIISL